MSPTTANGQKDYWKSYKRINKRGEEDYPSLLIPLYSTIFLIDKDITRSIL